MNLCLIVITVLLSFLGLRVTERNELYDGKIESVEKYMASHLDLINIEIESMGYDIKLKSFVSYSVTILPISEEKRGRMIIFDDDCFYFLIGDNLELFDYGTSISLEEKEKLFEGTLIYDDLVSDYFFYDSEKKIKSFNSVDSSLLFETEFETSKKYDGQDEAGETTIFDTKAYISSKYGNNFKLDDYMSLTYSLSTKGKIYSMEGFDQNKLSCYMGKPGMYNGGEGNCCVVAPFTIARYIMRKNYRRQGYADRNIQIYDPKVEEEKIYKSKMEDDNRFNLKDESERKWCELYRKFRKKSYEKYGKVEGLKIWESCTLLKDVMSEYGIKMDVDFIVNERNSINTVISQIDNSTPVLFSTIGGYYGSHTMCIAGYEIWKKTEKILFFKQTTKKILVELRDGISTKEIVYMDFSVFNDETLAIGFFSTIKR